MLIQLLLVLTWSWAAAGEGCMDKVAQCYRDRLSTVEKSTDKRDIALLECIDSENCEFAKNKTCIDFPKKDKQYIKRKWIVLKCEEWGMPFT